MSFGKSSGSSIPALSQEQKDYIKAQTDFFTKTVQPTYDEIVKGAKEVYNANLPGTMKAAENLGGVAGKVQETLGSTGESAARTGVTGLENLFNKDYEAQQVQAALAPAQMQYQQNVANQAAQFGGAGQLGSARQALAGQQMAGANAAQQAAIAAQVSGQVAGQRQQAANSLMNYGLSGLQGALGAAGTGVTAAGLPFADYSKLASLEFGTPPASYSNMGPTGTTTSGKSATFAPKF